MRVYYARAVDSCDWDEVQARRNQVVDAFSSIGMEVINEFSGGFDTDKELVESQVSNIKRCDILVAELTIPRHPYVGCIGEIIYAHQFGKKVYVVYGENEHIRHRPWLSYHTDAFFKTFDDLFSHLKKD